MGGGIQKRIYLVEHQSGLDANQKRQRIAQDTGGWIAHPDPEHWVQKSSTGDNGLNQQKERTHKTSIYQRDNLGTTLNPLHQNGGGNSQSNTRVNYGVWNERGFPKAHRLTA